MKQLLTYFGFYKVLVFFVIGCVILLTDYFTFIDTALKRYGLGLLFIGYSVYRIIQIYKKVKVKTEN